MKESSESISFKFWEPHFMGIPSKMCKETKGRTLKLLTVSFPGWKNERPTFSLVSYLRLNWDHWKAQRFVLYWYFNTTLASMTEWLPKQQSLPEAVTNVRVLSWPGYTNTLSFTSPYMQWLKLEDSTQRHRLYPSVSRNPTWFLQSFISLFDKCLNWFGEMRKWQSPYQTTWYSKIPFFPLSLCWL